MNRPETTLPNPNVYINTGKPVGPSRPPEGSGISTGIRSASWGDSGPSPLRVVIAVLAVFVAAPFAAWALYIAAHLPVWAWYASLFPH